MNKEQIKHMVDRFLAWKLPRDTFNPDCGISFDKGPVNAHTAHPSLYEPTGTNLFDAGQADAMVRHMIEGLPSDDAKDLRELLAKVRFRLKAQTDVGIVSTNPENEDPQHEFTEILVDIDDALGIRD